MSLICHCVNSMLTGTSHPCMHTLLYVRFVGEYKCRVGFVALSTIKKIRQLARKKYYEHILYKNQQLPYYRGIKTGGNVKPLIPFIGLCDKMDLKTLLNLGYEISFK